MQQSNTLQTPAGAKGTPALLTAEQLAAELQVSKRSIAYWRSSGIIPSVTVGRHLVRFDVGDVIAHLKRRTAKYGGASR